MVKIEDVEVMGMRKAIKGMRNAMNSWDKSDSEYGCLVDENDWVNKEKCPVGYVTKCKDCTWCEPLCYDNHDKRTFIIGEADMKLCKNLIKAGSPDRKFMRMIHVQMDVTAPLYWWKEFDTYKVGTVANSCSTMHTLHKRDLTLDDFSHENLISDSVDILKDLINTLNDCRDSYINYDKDINLITKEITSKKHIWWQMIQLLPSSFNQMRTIDLNYETLFSIYHQRKCHKLNEWVEFCKWIETLPYMKEFLGLDEQVEKEKRELP